MVGLVCLSSKELSRVWLICKQFNFLKKMTGKPCQLVTYDRSPAENLLRSWKQIGNSSVFVCCYRKKLFRDRLKRAFLLMNSKRAISYKSQALVCFYRDWLFGSSLLVWWYRLKPQMPSSRILKRSDWASRSPWRILGQDGLFDLRYQDRDRWSHYEGVNRECVAKSKYFWRFCPRCIFWDRAESQATSRNKVLGPKRIGWPS